MSEGEPTLREIVAAIEAAIEAEPGGLCAALEAPDWYYYLGRKHGYLEILALLRSLVARMEKGYRVAKADWIQSGGKDDEAKGAFDALRAILGDATPGEDEEEATP